MITAIVNIDLYRYEIHSLLKAFFPQEDVKVLTKADAEGNRKYREIAKDPFLSVEYAPEEVALSFCDGSDTRAAAAPPGISYAQKSPGLKTELKHLLYAMLADREQRTLPWGELIGIRPTKIAMQSMLDGMTPEEAAAAMEQDHLVSPEKARLSADIAQREREILAHIHDRGGYSIYIGIPFCPTTCLYCSFPSYNLALWKDRVDAYLDALEKEMEASSALMRDWILDTVYIGGGTPTTLEPRQLERLFSMLNRYFSLKDILEFTVEAGRPDSITADKLRVIRAHDVSRISVNPQTMNEETLRLIGRRHTVEDVRQAFALCRDAGFDNINMDIILGLPGEAEEHVRRTLQEIEKLSPDSLTVHSLALKRGSRMQKYIEEKGFSSIQNTDGCMELAAESAARMGMSPYYLYRQKNISGNLENVGYARVGKAGIYNILIMEEKQSILALGAGSISKAVFPGGRIERSDNCKDVGTYLENIDEMIERKKRLGIGREDAGL
ncbi:MAG: coproporphyrinogen dehydrogenase HemZ [Eubacteriales bacterium]|nr:coproporphyrinogen dehydrogenase HemZ [Eubacteriales bacterium]